MQEKIRFLIRKQFETWLLLLLKEISTFKANLFEKYGEVPF